MTKAGCSRAWSGGGRSHSNALALRRANHVTAEVSPMRSGLFLPLFDELADVVAEVTALRTAAGGDAPQPYDVVVALPPGSDPAPYAAVGATWSLVELPQVPVSVDQVRGVIRDGTASR